MFINTCQSVKIKGESLTSLLQQGKFTSYQFDKLLVKQDGFNHILLSDANSLMQQIKEEFPDIVKIESIGKSWEGRDINMLEIDARDHYGTTGDSAQRI